MDVIFLDFDGVLNFEGMLPQAYACKRGKKPPATCLSKAGELDHDCIKRLNELVRRTKASVVFSTSWRLAFDDDGLQHILEDAGFIGQVIGSTPRGGRDFWRDRGLEMDRLERGHQIAQFILETPTIERCVILDDSIDMWTLHPLLVNTDAGFGLTSEDVAQAARTLDASWIIVNGLRRRWRKELAAR